MFTTEQLEGIKFAASRTKNQGELAVLHYLYGQTLSDNVEYFTEQQWNIIEYCAEECKRQRSGEMSVYDMVNAWEYASNLAIYPTKLHIEYIKDIGMLVEPIDNRNGFRKVPIGIWDGYIWKEKDPWEKVPTNLEYLLESYYNGSMDDNSTGWWHPESKSATDEFYYGYENIHPFFDGNGRSGKILYNYLNGTLENPIMPPNFWGSSNP